MSDSVVSALPAPKASSSTMDSKNLLLLMIALGCASCGSTVADLSGLRADCAANEDCHLVGGGDVCVPEACCVTNAINVADRAAAQAELKRAGANCLIHPECGDGQCEFRDGIQFSALAICQDGTCVVINSLDQDGNGIID